MSGDWNSWYSWDDDSAWTSWHGDDSAWTSWSLNSDWSTCNWKNESAWKPSRNDSYWDNQETQKHIAWDRERKNKHFQVSTGDFHASISSSQRCSVVHQGVLSIGICFLVRRGRNHGFLIELDRVPMLMPQVGVCSVIVFHSQHDFPILIFCDSSVFPWWRRTVFSKLCSGAVLLIEWTFS